jgi:hypothetical protein
LIVDRSKTGAAQLEERVEILTVSRSVPRIESIAYFLQGVDCGRRIGGNWSVRRRVDRDIGV